MRNKTIILIIFVALTIAFLAIIYFYRNDKEKRNDSLISFTMTTLGIFIGVYFADYVNEKRIVRNEKIQIKSILEQSVNELKGMMEDVSNILKISQQKGRDIGYFLNNNPTYKPEMLDNLISNDLFSKYCLPISVPIISNQRNIKSRLKTANDADKEPENRVGAVVVYYLYLEMAEKQLEETIRFIDGEIDEDQLKQINRKLVQDTISKAKTPIKIK